MNNELMLYTMDCSWAGMIVVVARNEDEARNLMRTCENYNERETINAVPIREGLIIFNYGDL